MTDLSPPHQPRNLEQATALATRYAVIDQTIAVIERERGLRIAAANSIADGALEPLVKLRDQVTDKLAAWWRGAAADLTKGKRRSIELGGCTIGYRKAVDRLAHRLDGDDKALAALQGSPYRKATITVKYSIDRKATLKLLQGGGKKAQGLEAIGFSIDAGKDAFFVSRIEQGGTISA